MNLTTRQYDDIKRQIKNITKGEYPDLLDDFTQEVLLIFLENPRASELMVSGEYKWYIIRIALNQFRSSTSTFYYKYKKHKSIELTENIDMEEENYDYEKDEAIELIMNGLDQMYKSFNDRHRYEAIIILLYYSTGESYTKLGKTLEVDRTTISKTFKRGIENLKEYYIQKDIEIPSTISKAIIDSKILKEIQTPKEEDKRAIYEKWIRDNQAIFFNNSMRTPENNKMVYEIFNYFNGTNEKPKGCGACIAQKYHYFQKLYF